MKTELGYDVSGPDVRGELEVRDYSPGSYDIGVEDRDESVYLTHADLVAMLALYDEVAEQADEQEDAV